MRSKESCIKRKIVKAINKGRNYFIFGMALGFDIIVAEMLSEEKKINE